MTEKEKALAGMEFVRGDKDLKRQRECAELLCFALNPVCPGVTIGDDCVIGAGSVVVNDIPAGSVAVGNPCRVIRRAEDEREGSTHAER